MSLGQHPNAGPQTALMARFNSTRTFPIRNQLVSHVNRTFSAGHFGKCHIALGRRPRLIMSVAPLARYVPGRQLQLELNGYCGKRLMPGVDAVRISRARRSAFKRLAAFERAASTRLEFLELLVLFESGILTLPSRPGWRSSSRASNSSELLTLITPVLTVEGGRG